MGERVRGDVRRMKLISLFDGIGGFPLAWCNVTGQAPADLHYQSSEIEPWPMAVVRQRFPHAEELGSVTTIQSDRLQSIHSIGGGRDSKGSSSQANGCGSDHIITFGSPCQDLSVAGRGAGLAGERSGLFHEAMRLVRDIRPRPKYFIWENVAGAFSSNNGNDFAAVLQSTADIGYDAVWTVLDAQWCGVPQRRRRVFLLGVRDGIPAGADIFSFGRRATELCRSKVQLIRKSRSRNTATSREAGQAVAGTIKPGAADGGFRGDLDTCGAYPLANPDPVIMQPRYARNGRGAPDVVSSPLDAEGGATSDKRQIVAAPVIRRLTPVECLRLQGFPDDWFDGVPGYSDTKAYRAVGNSVAIPCVEWIFQRVLEFDEAQE